MWAVIVVTLQESHQNALLLQEVEAGRFGGLFFECQVHTLMTAILLWMAWFDTFDADTQTQPPHGQSAEAKQGMG